MHGEAQVGEGGKRGGVGGLFLHATLHAEEALAEGALFVGVAELAQELPHPVGEAPGLFDLTQRGGEIRAAGLHFLEDAALENAALVGPVGVKPARAVRAQGAARLGKTPDGIPAAGESHGQAQRFQVLRVVARLELHAVEERAVAAQAADQAELFAGSHAAASGSGSPERKLGAMLDEKSGKQQAALRPLQPGGRRGGG